MRTRSFESDQDPIPDRNTDRSPQTLRLGLLSMSSPGITDSPQDEYRLEDFGHGRRLERLGRWLVDRPAPQADQAPRNPDWHADWVYDAARSGAGRWRPASGADLSWPIRVAGLKLHCRLAAGGQVGLYPEHIACWNWLRTLLRQAPSATPMLNLFAASGGASLAAAQAGAVVTHVDAQAAALGLARSNLDRLDARILREDVPQFVARALRRGDRYPLIVLDPPSFGRGPKGQTWTLGRDLPALLPRLRELLGPQPLGLWLSAHTPGWDVAALAAQLRASFPEAPPRAFPLGLRSADGRILPGGHAAVCEWQG